MRMIDLKFEPPKLQISQQEIMDDLRYPVARKRPEGNAVTLRKGRGA